MKPVIALASKQIVFSLLLAILLLARCGSKDKAGDATMISGTSSKTWKIDKERNASGDKVKLSGDEKKETMVFYNNGTFSINATNQQQGGNWNYDMTNKNLSLQFNGDTHTENFKVNKLTNSEMELLAGDGSKMILQAD